jgi:hypothetical protein
LSARTINSVRSGVLSLTLAVTLAASLGSGAGATTAPGQKTVIRVTLTDKGIAIQYNGQEARGVIVSFQAVNDGKKPHSFTLFGHKTPVLKPGKKASFTVTLVHRGLFPYRSTVDTGKAFRGNFIVY